jgi:guanylate kinase
VRLANAKAELEYGRAEGNFDRVFVNGNLDECFGSIVEAFETWYPHLKDAAGTV